MDILFKIIVGEVDTVLWNEIQLKNLNRRWGQAIVLTTTNQNKTVIHVM